MILSRCRSNVAGPGSPKYLRLPPAYVHIGQRLRSAAGAPVVTQTRRLRFPGGRRIGVECVVGLTAPSLSLSLSLSLLPAATEDTPFFLRQHRP